jgi:hypothetical protein
MSHLERLAAAVTIMGIAFAVAILTHGGDPLFPIVLAVGALTMAAL